MRARRRSSRGRIALLEREDDLATLAAALSRARAGEGRVVLIGGEAGIGKTSLLRAFAATADVPVHVGRCEPLDVPAPLAPMRDLAPTLGRRFAAALRSDPGSVARALLTALAEPALVAVEDVHWADAATLDVLRVAARRLDTVPAMLVLTYRDEGPTARALAGELASSEHIVRVMPRPLSRAAVDELARGAGADGGRLFAATAGNPFLVVESLTTPDRIPPTVHDAVLARTTRLSPAARGALDVAAAIGQNVDLELLRRVSAADPDAVDECVESGILVVSDGSLAFRHELIRAVVEATVSPGRRAELHRRIARELAAAASAGHSRVAHHAALGGDHELVVWHGSAAADEAFSAGAVREALAQRERALRSASKEQRAELLLAVGATAYLADDPRRTLETLREAAELRDDPLFLSRVNRNLSRAYWLLDRWPEAERAARDAAELAAQTGDADEQATATAWLSGFLAVGHFPDAPQVALRAIDASRTAGNTEALAAATISLGLSLGLGGDRTGLELLQEGRELALRENVLPQAIRGYVNALVVAMIVRDFGVCDALFPEARSFFEERFLHNPLDDLTQSYARSLVDRGRLDDAAALLAAAPRANLVEGVLIDALDALILVRRGLPGASAILDRVLAPVAGAPDGFRELLIRLARAELAWHDGDLDAGRREAALALALPIAARLPWQAGELAVWAVRCGAEIPDVAVAGPFADELAGRDASPAWLALGCPFDAALASLAGDDAAARAAVADLTRMGATGTVRAFSRARAELGLRVPRGPRSTTDDLGLTVRERDVLALVAAGKRNADIAAALHITEKTAGHHVSACLRKLGVRSRAEAAAVWATRTQKMGSSPDVPEGRPA